MPATVRLEFVNIGSPVWSREVVLPLELGRQDERKGDPASFTLLPTTDGRPARFILARHDEKDISRRHVLIEDAGADRCSVTNTFDSKPLEIQDDQPVAPSEKVQLKLPFTLRLPAGKTVRFAAVAGAGSSAGARVAPEEIRGISFGASGLPSCIGATIGSLQDKQSPVAALHGWLQETLRTLQKTIAADDFMRAAAVALVTIGRMDTGRVLLFDQRGAARVLLCHPPSESDEWKPSTTLTQSLRCEKKTFWHNATASPSESKGESLRLIETAVAAPLLDRNGEVIGALYGERGFKNGGSPPEPIGEVEALLVEILACGVAGGMNRVRHQAEVAAKQVMLEQFFGKKLATLLEARPELIKEGRKAEVTLLFCDLRFFSAISEALKEKGTVDWIHDVMTELSRCVLEEDGLVVDYIGDELMAMWGGAVEQNDHPSRAAKAGLAMLKVRDALRSHYQGRLGRDGEGKDIAFDLGIGLNSGEVYVGNTGSDQKFKYGPLGHPVNLASRVQGLTKYLKCGLLVTGTTWKRLRGDPLFLARRVCKVRVMNIQEQVDIYAIENDNPERRKLVQGTEKALEYLEEGKFTDAAWEAGDLLRQYRGDGPCRLILWRATEMLVKEGKGFDPVWEPPGK